MRRWCFRAWEVGVGGGREIDAASCLVSLQFQKLLVRGQREEISQFVVEDQVVEDRCGLLDVWTRADLLQLFVADLPIQLRRHGAAVVEMRVVMNPLPELRA